MPVGVRLALRPYQEEAIQKTLDAEVKGVRSQLGVAPVGAGKTVIFCSLAAQRGGRTLIFAHRDELVSQAVSKVKEIWPSVGVGVVKGPINDLHAHVVVASVQTISRPARLQQLIDSAPFDLVICDEAHHSAATTYRKVLTGLRAGESDGPLLLGVTATPDRGDGKGLHDIFDEIVWSYDILWAIKAGYLCDVRGIQVRLDDLSLSGVRVRRGDYDQGEVGKRMEHANSPEHIFDAWKQHASSRTTVVFTPTVEVARLVSERFQQNGVTAGMVSAGTPIEERRHLLDAFARGSLQVVVNVGVLTEGYDNPRMDCVLIARPTRSRALFTQMIGRGLRKHPDKFDCLVLDVVGASADNSLVTVPSLFGVEPRHQRLMDGAKGTLMDAISAFEHEQMLLGKLTSEEVDLLRNVRSEGISWARVHKDGEKKKYVKSLGRDENDVVRPTVVLAECKNSKNWVAGLQHSNGRKEVLIIDVPLEMAQGVAEEYVRNNSNESIFRTDAPWRKRRPTSRQLAAAEKWKMKVDPSWTAGQLSDELDAHIARKKAQPRKPVPAWVKKKYKQKNKK